MNHNPERENLRIKNLARDDRNGIKPDGPLVRTRTYRKIPREKSYFSENKEKISSSLCIKMASHKDNKKESSGREAKDQQLQQSQGQQQRQEEAVQAAGPKRRREEEHGPEDGRRVQAPAAPAAEASTTSQGPSPTELLLLQAVQSMERARTDMEAVRNDARLAGQWRDPARQRAASTGEGLGNDASPPRCFPLVVSILPVAFK